MQYKQVINPNFIILMLEVQELIKDGWEIDQENLPTNSFVYYEVNLVKKEAEKKPGRPAKENK